VLSFLALTAFVYQLGRDAVDTPTLFKDVINVAKTRKDIVAVELVEPEPSKMVGGKRFRMYTSADHEIRPFVVRASGCAHTAGAVSFLSSACTIQK
jgi:hypothetical protein